MEATVVQQEIQHVRVDLWHNEFEVMRRQQYIAIVCTCVNSFELVYLKETEPPGKMLCTVNQVC